MRKKQIIIILLILAVSLASFIYFLREDDPVTNLHTPTPSVTEENTITPTLNIPSKELKIYSINENGEILPVTALISATEVTPWLIVDEVINSMEDASYYIKIDTITTDENTVIVSFSSETPPSTGVSEKVETVILDALAQSLLDNLDDYYYVIYQVNSGAYQSEFKSFPIDYIYLENKK